MKLCRLCLLILCIFYAGSECSARDILVSSASRLQTEISKAKPHDTVTFAAGSYIDIFLTISASDIILKTETPGTVFFNGQISISITGNNVTLNGLQFTNGSNPEIVITVSGNDVVLSELNFSGYTAKKYISLSGLRDCVSYCNFENKPDRAPKGNLIHIETRKDGKPSNALIRYCSFKNMPGRGGDNGNECIRITNGEPPSYNAGTIVEYCYFTHTGCGDSEAISVKSAGNILRYNTMCDNPGANFCFRNGNNNTAYGNYFIRSGGIRLKEASSIICTQNYFENCGDGAITAPVKYVSVKDKNAHTDIIINENIFNGGSSIELSGDARSNCWKNNIFVNQKHDIFTGDSSGIFFSENRYYGALGLKIMDGFYEDKDILVKLKTENGPLSEKDAGPSYLRK